MWTVYVQMCLGPTVVIVELVIEEMERKGLAKVRAEAGDTCLEL